jgi:hypothetical protein
MRDVIIILLFLLISYVAIMLSLGESDLVQSNVLEYTHPDHNEPIPQKTIN